MESRSTLSVFVVEPFPGCFITLAKRPVSSFLTAISLAFLFLQFMQVIHCLRYSELNTPMVTFHVQFDSGCLFHAPQPPTLTFLGLSRVPPHSCGGTRDKPKNFHRVVNFDASTRLQQSSIRPHSILFHSAINSSTFFSSSRLKIKCYLIVVIITRASQQKFQRSVVGIKLL